MRISTNSGLHSARENKERYTPKAAMEFFSKMGFEVLDMNFSASIYEGPYKIDRTLVEPGWQQQIEDLKLDLDQRNIAVRYAHLPFYAYDDPNTEGMDFKYEMTLRSIEASGMLGVEWAVLHPSRLSDQNEALKQTKDYVDMLLETARRHRVGLAIENMGNANYFGGNVDALCDLVDSYNGDLGICWDTGHANLAKMDQPQAIRKIGHRLKVLHIHDNSGEKDEHRPPYLGTVDWVGVMTALAEIGFSGDLNFEVTASLLPERLREEHAQYIVSAGKHLISIFEDALGGQRRP